MKPKTKPKPTKRAPPTKKTTPTKRAPSPTKTTPKRTKTPKLRATLAQVTKLAAQLTRAPKTPGRAATLKKLQRVARAKVAAAFKPTPKTKRAPPPKKTRLTKKTKKTKSTPKKKAAPKVTPTLRARPGRREKAAPTLPEELRRDEGLALGAGAFPETRFFTSAASLIGYVEGRPGVKGILAAFPARGGEARSSSWTPEQRAEMKERLDASPPAQEKRAEGGYDAWAAFMMAALEYADDGGLLAEVEVESDSGAAE